MTPTFPIDDTQFADETLRSINKRPFRVQKIVLDLTTASNQNGLPYFAINIPFSAVFVRTASDSLTNVSLLLDEPSQLQDASGIPLYINDYIRFPDVVGRGYLSWTAQSGKSITLFIFTRAEFQSGSQLSLSAGGVSINEGSSVTSSAYSTVTTSAAILLAANTNRKVTMIQNQGLVPIFVGGSTVTIDSGAAPGIKINPGENFLWKNTAALYAVAASSNSSIASITEV